MRGTPIGPKARGAIGSGPARRLLDEFLTTARALLDALAGRPGGPPRLVPIRVESRPAVAPSGRRRGRR